MCFRKAIQSLLYQGQGPWENEDKFEEGFVNVYVGKEGQQIKKFKVPLKYLSTPTFRAFLERSKEEFGEQISGPIKIPCEIEVFERGLKRVKYNEKEEKCKELSYDERLWPAWRFVKVENRTSPSSLNRGLLGGRMRYGAC